MAINRSDLDLTKDEDIVTLVEEMRSEAETGNQRRRERMRRCRRFRVGDQWDDDVKSWYKSGRKHALTINLLLPTVNQVSGVHAENKKDITARPTRGGTDTAARIISALLKYTLHDTRFHQEHTQAFTNAIGDGAGYLLVERDFSVDPRTGNLGIRRLNPFAVFPDPGVEEYDLNKSGQYIIWHEWIDEERGKLQWPKQADKLRTGDSNDVNQQGIFTPIVKFFYGDQDDYRENDNETLDENRKHRIRITHTWWKEWREVAYVYRLDDDELEPLKITKPKEIEFAKNAAKENPQQFDVIDRIEPIMHHTKTNHQVFLEDTPNPWANVENPNDCIMKFPIIPIYAYFEDGYIFSLVENLISPQEEHNFARSTLLNISKKLANTGWMGKGLGSKFRQWLEIHSGQDGIIIDIPEKAKQFEKIEPTSIPNNEVLNANMAKQDIGDIANVKLDRSDFSKQNLTNQARAIKERDALTASNTMFANDEHSMLILGEFLAEAIRTTGIYSEAEIKAIVDDGNLLDERIMQDAAELLAQQGIEMPQPPANIEQQAQLMQDQPEALQAFMQGVQQEMNLFQQLQQQYQAILKETAEAVIFEEIRSIAVGKYGMQVDQQSHSPTMRIANFLEMLELHKTLLESNYAGVPREQLIEASDVPNKAAIAATPAQVQPSQTALEAA